MSFRYTLSYSAWKRSLGDSFAFACNAVCNFWTLDGVVRLIANPSVLRCFLRSSLTEVPSLHRSYPLSQVLRTPPPPIRPGPSLTSYRFDPDHDHRWGFPCCAWSPLRTCHRHYPRQVRQSLFARRSHRQRPSLCNSQVGSCNYCFGACSAFTHVMACTLTESPSDPLHRKLRQLRCLRRRFDCYRVERTSSRQEFAPAEVQRLSRRTVTPIAHLSQTEVMLVKATQAEWSMMSAFSVDGATGEATFRLHRNWPLAYASGKQNHAQMHNPIRSSCSSVAWADCPGSSGPKHRANHCRRRAEQSSCLEVEHGLSHRCGIGWRGERLRRQCCLRSVFRVDTTGNVTVVAGNGARGGYSNSDGVPAVSVRLINPPAWPWIIPANVFIADSTYCKISKVSAQTGIISAVAGTGTCGYSGDGGPATSAQLEYPHGVAVDGSRKHLHRGYLELHGS